jgi:hypothetical protein
MTHLLEPTHETQSLYHNVALTQIPNVHLAFHLVRFARFIFSISEYSMTVRYRWGFHRQFQRRYRQMLSKTSTKDGQRDS